jgi:oligosaccharide repeat unit polymerase
MQVALILFVSLIVLITSLRLFATAAGTLSLTKLNTVSYVFYVQIFLMTFVGSILAACHVLDFHELISRVSDNTKIYGWLCVLYSMIAMPLAMISLNALFKVKAKRDFNEYIFKPIQFQQGPVLSIVVLLIFTGISASVLIYTISFSGSIPFLTLLAGSLKEAAIQRVEARYSFGGFEYIRNLLGYLMMPIFAYYSAIYAFEKRKTIYWLFFAANSLMTIFLLVFDIQKAPIVFFLFGFIILYTLRKGGVSRKRLIVYVVLGVLLISGGYSLTQGKDFVGQITDIGSSLWGRVFISEYAGLLLSLEYFPDVITQPTWYIGLPSFILSFFGAENIESARLLMMHINPKGVASGEANLISSYYMAEAWANYGWIGLILSPIIVGWVVQSVHIFLLKHSKQPLPMAFYSYITVRWVLSSGFVNFLYLKIILYPLILYYLFKVVINSLPKRKLSPMQGYQP